MVDLEREAMLVELLTMLSYVIDVKNQDTMSKIVLKHDWTQENH